MIGWLLLVGDRYILFCFGHDVNGSAGKRIVQLQTSLALVQNPANSAGPVAEDPHGRQPFAHPALEGLDSLSDSTKVLFTGKTKLAQLAQKYDMQNVLRWSPRKVCPFSFYFSPVTLLTNVYSPTTSLPPESNSSWLTQCTRLSAPLLWRREDISPTRWPRTGYWNPWA